MAFPTAGVLDDFNRANGAPGSNWTADTIGQGGLVLSIDTNRVKSGTQAYCEMYWNPATFGADSEVYITVPVLPSGASASFGLMIRAQSPGSAACDGYRLSVDAGTGTITVAEVLNGAETTLGATISNTIAAGDSYGLEMVGSTLTVYKKTSGGSWTSVGTRSDGTYSTAGNVGMWMYDPGTPGRLDDFGGGTVSGAGSQTINPGFISAGSQLFAPTLAPGQVTLAPGHLASTAQLFAPTLAPGSVTVSPAHLASTAQLFTPTLDGGDVPEITRTWLASIPTIPTEGRN